MKNLITLFVCIFIRFAGFGQVYYEESWPKLQNPAKSLLEKSWLVKEVSGQITKQQQGWESFSQHDFEIHFDQSGAIMQKKAYHPNGVLIHSTSFVYDALGSQVEKNCKEFDGRTVIFNDSVIYDNNNRVARVYQKLSGDELDEPDERYHISQLLKRDSIGQILELALFISDSTLYSRLKYQYDSQGNQVRIDRYSHADTLFSVKKIEYDQHRNASKTEWYYPPNILNETTYYTYTANKYVSSVKKKMSDGKTLTHQFVYTLDDRQNWVTRVEYINGQAKYLVERAITYYP